MIKKDIRGRRSNISVTKRNRVYYFGHHMKLSLVTLKVRGDIAFWYCRVEPFHHTVLVGGGES
jgi:hypothetical protein